MSTMCNTIIALLEANKVADNNILLQVQSIRTWEFTHLVNSGKSLQLSAFLLCTQEQIFQHPARLFSMRKC
jgi:hypothetical protein